MRLLIAVAILFLAGSVLAQAYRWVDEEGIVHFSDRPHPGAERIQLPSDNRVSFRRPAAPPPVARANARQPATEFNYDRLEIASPAAEETLWNIEGVLNVSLNLSPELQDGHRIRVHFDGNPRLVSSTSFQIEEVWRGVHNLQAEVVDATGKLMIRSVPNRFYVQQNTIIRAN
ncbi:MAG: DUF4124 domain-containing protein [Woeseiaceae bacterium]